MISSESTDRDTFEYMNKHHGSGPLMTLHGDAFSNTDPLHIQVNITAI